MFGINEELRIKVIEFNNNHTNDTNIDIDIDTIIPPHCKHKSECEGLGLGCMVKPCRARSWFYVVVPRGSLLNN